MSDSIQVLSIGEVVEKIIGGGTPSREVKEYYKGNIPWFTVKDLTYHRLSKSQEYITESALENSSTNLIPRGNVIVATRIALGRAFINEVDAAINQDLKALIPNKRKITAEYLLYSILHKANIIEKMGTGTTVKGIRLEQLKSLLIHVPPIKEQKKIASILSTVDRAIEKTEAIIEQTEKVKKGLMQQLLTKGIGHTKFKKTEIGEIPEEWEVKTIGEIGSLKSGTTPSREKAELYYKGGEIPWVKTMDLNNSFIVDTHEKVTNLALEETSLSIIPKGSVLVAMYGGFNQIGRTGLLKIDATINQALTAILINTELIEPEFLLIWLNYKVNHWKKFAASSRKDPNITKNDVANFPVVIPSLEEQRKIYTTILNISLNP